jgi:hypothetical protein
MTWQFQCPGCSAPVLIPPGSPLDKSVGPQDQPMDIWPIDFLCCRCERVFERTCQVSGASAPSLVRGEELAFLWVIEGACAHKNCGRSFAIYTKQPASASESSTILALLEAKPPYQCRAGHPCEMKAEAMTARLV